MTIKEQKCWTWERLRNMCIKHNLYTLGDNEAYDNLFTSMPIDPDTEAIYMVAKDISEHSEDKPIEHIMYLVANEVVRTYYELAE